MAIQSMDDLLQSQLQMLYSIETQLVNALPMMAESANSDALKTALNQHLETTKQQAKRLEEIGQSDGIVLTGIPDRGMENMLKEGMDLVQNIEDPDVKDAAIMGDAGKIEHHEMAAYQSAISTAKKIGRDEVADKLEETLQEEQRTAKAVEAMAGNGIMNKITDALS